MSKGAAPPSTEVEVYKNQSPKEDSWKWPPNACSTVFSWRYEFTQVKWKHASRDWKYNSCKWQCRQRNSFLRGRHGGKEKKRGGGNSHEGHPSQKAERGFGRPSGNQNPPLGCHCSAFFPVILRACSFAHICALLLSWPSDAQPHLL